VPVLQSLSWDASSLPTVIYSTHTAYGPPSGRRIPAEEIRELYTGLQAARVTAFNVVLTGYIPSGDAVETVGQIVRNIKLQSATSKEPVFWALDPVMGDQGKLYVDESVVRAYKELAREADLILPNAFETE
jgi:pyridoxine kinase